jgi:protein-S-isoprenylcysteine O-methyltransferase Ste14
MTRNLALLFVSFTVYIVIGALLEERKLLAIFGERYEKYRTATPFLIPFLF